MQRRWPGCEMRGALPCLADDWENWMNRLDRAMSLNKDMRPSSSQVNDRSWKASAIDKHTHIKTDRQRMKQRRWQGGNLNWPAQTHWLTDWLQCNCKVPCHCLFLLTDSDWLWQTCQKNAPAKQKCKAKKKSTRQEEREQVAFLSMEACDGVLAQRLARKTLCTLLQRGSAKLYHFHKQF